MLTKYFLTLKKFLLRLEKKFQDKNTNIKIQL